MKYKVPSPPKSTQSTQVADPESMAGIDWVSRLFGESAPVTADLTTY
jgi:hypothetical protein